MSEPEPASTLESPTTGLLLVVSSPSGAGKTTLARRLLGEFTDLRFSVSYTTRPQRGREQDGVDYHFVSEATFDQMIAAGAFAEWCLVHNRRYGTSVETLRTALCLGQHVLLDIDYQGAAKLREQLPKESRLVFILPPSLPILEQRLRSRGSVHRAHGDDTILDDRFASEGVTAADGGRACSLFDQREGTSTRSILDQDTADTGRSVVGTENQASRRDTGVLHRAGSAKTADAAREAV